MFEDLYDAISVLWSKRWPSVESEITAADIERVPGRRKDRLRLAVAYKFFVGEDGPYTGVSFWDPPRSWSEQRTIAAKNRFQVGQQIRVRYRSDNPSVNTLDRATWTGL